MLKLYHSINTTSQLFYRNFLNNVKSGKIKQNDLINQFLINNSDARDSDVTDSVHSNFQISTILFVA